MTLPKKVSPKGRGKMASIFGMAGDSNDDDPVRTMLFSTLPPQSHTEYASEEDVVADAEKGSSNFMSPKMKSIFQGKQGETRQGFFGKFNFLDSLEKFHETFGEQPIIFPMNPYIQRDFYCTGPFSGLLRLLPPGYFHEYYARRLHW